MAKKSASKGIVQTIHVSGGSSGEKIGKSFGRAIDEMIKFIRDRRLVAMEIVGEPHSFPGRTDRLIVIVPKPPEVKLFPGNLLRRLDRRAGGRRR